MKHAPTLLWIIGPVAAGVALAGCASTGNTPEPTSSVAQAPQNAPIEDNHNDADAMFAQMMIPHHEQALAMSETVLAKDRIDPAVADLAQQIAAAQAPEIERLTDMLEVWGEPVTPEAMNHSMDGMMTPEQMEQLEEADGSEAATLFLTQMIEHHEGAVDMAEQELAEGQNREALQLAQEIVEAQVEEIGTMERLLTDG